MFFFGPVPKCSSPAATCMLAAQVCKALAACLQCFLSASSRLWLCHGCARIPFFLFSDSMDVSSVSVPSSCYCWTSNHAFSLCHCLLFSIIIPAMNFLWTFSSSHIPCHEISVLQRDIYLCTMRVSVLLDIKTRKHFHSLPTNPSWECVAYINRGADT